MRVGIDEVPAGGWIESNRMGLAQNRISLERFQPNRHRTGWNDAKRDFRSGATEEVEAIELNEIRNSRQSSRRILAVMRRCPTPLSMLGALLALGIGSQPMFTRADSINPNASTATADYRLTSDTSLPVPDANSTGPQVVAMVLPPGSVVPPKLADGTEGSPLTILPDSHGFDASHLVVALKNATTSTGQAEQMFGLVFFGQGLQQGGVLHFALNIDKALANNPPVLQATTPGISITPDPIATTPMSNGSAGTPSSNEPSATPAQVPEPLSVVLWSTLAGALVVRGRGLRKLVPKSTS
jgi:hypothetical protein